MAARRRGAPSVLPFAPRGRQWNNATIMSGPITCGFFIMHGVLILAARALQEARAMHREYGDVLAQMTERERAQAFARAGQRNARLERIAAVRGEAARQEARFARLQSLAQTFAADAPELGERVDAPRAPSGDDDAAWTDYLRRMETAVRELETLLGRAGDAFGERLRAALTASAAAPTIDEVLSAYVLQRHMKSGLDAAQAETFRETAARVLARLELPADAALPTELEALAREIVLAPTLERAEALATQLRFAVQQARTARAAQQSEAAEAKAMLEGMPDDVPAALAASARARCRRRSAPRRRASPDGAERARRDRRRSRARRAVGRRCRADRIVARPGL